MLVYQRVIIDNNVGSLKGQNIAAQIWLPRQHPLNPVSVLRNTVMLTAN